MHTVSQRCTTPVEKAHMAAAAAVLHRRVCAGAQPARVDAAAERRTLLS